jgi:mannitol/fructose-specific phosphotransferase system IIA component (Ntr-type)
VNFAANFDWRLVFTVLVLATVGKVAGCGLSARFCGWSRRESGAIGFAMNARGAMEIVFALVAFQNGIVSGRVFVALVVMALATSMMSGPAMRWLLRLAPPRQIGNHAGTELFLQPIQAITSVGAINELVEAAGAVADISTSAVYSSLFSCNFTTTSPMTRGVAVRMAAVDGLDGPVIGVGVPKILLDFDGSNEPVELIFLVLIPKISGFEGPALGELARVFKEADIRKRTLAAPHQRQFLSLDEALGPQGRARLAGWPGETESPGASVGEHGARHAQRRRRYPSPPPRPPRDST